MANDSEHPGFEFDVALSFAGEDRTYVEGIARRLEARGVRCFFDEQNVVEMWGVDLYVLLDEVYRKRSRYAVVFASRHYVDKPWPTHERQSIQARALEEKMPYVLPVRLDDTEVPGLRPTTGYLDARSISVDALVQAIEQKVRGTQAKMARPAAYEPRTPRSPEQMAELLGQRPLAWEYLMFAGVLLQGRNALEEKYRDHELGYARRTGRILPEAECIEHLNAAFDDARALAASMERVLDPRAQERAFGLPGEAGDPDRIKHLGQRLIDAYEGFLDWGAELRGARLPDRFRAAFDLAARLADQPVAEFREFVDRNVEEMDRVIDHISQPEPRKPLSIELHLVLNIDDDVIKAFNREIRRLR